MSDRASAPASRSGPELTAAPGPVAPAPPPLPRVPPELRAKFDRVRAEFAGERREVAVLFADLSGFTALSERMDPEEVSLLVSGLLGELSQAVFRYEGYVDKFIGDAIMALFGAPLAHENDPERAVLAALAMLEIVHGHNARGGVPLALRVGVNLGQVVATQIGAGANSQYTVMGDAVNVASRLEGKARPDSILVSEAVWRRISTRFTAQELPPLAIKGKSEAVRAHRILGFLPGMPPRPRGETPFVGRESELAAIGSFLRGAAAGGGGALLVEGDAGTGKSRLVREAIALSSVDLRAIEIGFSPIQLPGQRPALSEIFSRLVPEAGGGAVERALALLGKDGESHRAGFDDLACQGGVSETPELGGDDERLVARQNRWGALRALLAAAGRARPVLLVAEDVHWIDEATREFLEALVESGSAVALILTGRLLDDGWAPRGAQRLHLRPLDTPAADLLLGQLAGELEPALKRDLIRRAAGNPLFLEELARAAARGEQATPAGTVPGTLQGLLVSRIDRLEPSVRLLLQMASVLGSRFPTRLLSRMYELEPQPVVFQAALAALEEGRFLQLEAAGEARHRFYHALVQEAAYGGLLLRIRRVLHESAARLGEEHFGGRLDAEAPFFAHHYWEAGLLPAAAPHLWKAGRAAAWRHDLGAAERFLERAARALAEDSAVLGAVETRARFSETFGNVLLQRGKLDEAERWFRALEELGREERLGEWLVRGLEYRGRVAWYRGRLEEARRLFESALAELPGDEGPIAADLHNDLGVAFYYLGEAEQAFARHGRALRLREVLGDRRGMAKSFSNIGNLLVHFRDDLPAAEDHYRRALELSRAAGDRQLTCLTINNLGFVAMERGEWERAIGHFRAAADVQEEIGWAFPRYLLTQNEAQCEIALGRLGDALRHLRLCLEKGEAVLEPVSRINTRLYLFDMCLRALQDDRAAAHLDDARALATELGVEGQEDELRVREGRLLASRGRWSDAAEAFARAEEAARALSHPTAAQLARAHRLRSEGRLGVQAGETRPADFSARPPLAALAAYLAADADAARRPDAEAARALGRAGEAAAALGETALERAAFERQAEIWRELGAEEEAARGLRRAGRAMAELEARLPEEAREAFAAHPRNALLREAVRG